MRSMNKQQFFLSAFLCCVTVSSTQADELQSYLKEAALNNPGLEASFNHWKAAVERIPQMKALPDPRFNYTYYIEEVETRVGPQEQKFGLSQTFPWFGKRSLRGNAATEAAAAEQQRYEQEKNRLFYRVKSTYFEYEYLARAVEITQQHLILLENIEQVARTRLKAGASQSAAIQAQVELGKLENKLLTLEALRTPLSSKLSTALNRPSSPILPWPQSIDPIPAQFTDQEAQQWLHASSPELKRLAALVRKETDSEKLAHKARYPDLTFGLSYIQTGESEMPGATDSGKDPFMASVSVNLPIWFGKLKAGEQEAYYRRAAAENQRNEMENRLQTALQMALFQFRDAERKINLYSEALVPKAEQSLGVTRKSFEAGRISFTSLIDAERMLLEFQLSADRARADREIRLAEIEMMINRNIAEPGDSQ
jgi:cobalt-zinc-cadmium efflux system outer membrane protein